MKRYFLIAATAASLLLFNSCSDDNNGSNSNNGIGGLSTTVVTGVHTSTANNYYNWQAVPNIQFLDMGGNNYDYWSLKVGNYSGYLDKISADESYWRGYISYYEKDKYCNDVIHMDSLKIEITKNESGIAQATFIINYYTYNQGSYPSTSTQSIYFIKPATAGNINTLNVYNVANTFQFAFKTTANDNYNSWKFVSIPDTWMDNEGKMSMMIVPVIYTVFQL